MSENGPVELLQSIVARMRAEELRENPPLGAGLRAIVVEKAWVVGGEDEWSPMVLIQDDERTFHRMTGRELAELADRNPRFARWAVSPIKEDN